MRSFLSALIGLSILAFLIPLDVEAQLQPVPNLESHLPNSDVVAPVTVRLTLDAEDRERLSSRFVDRGFPFTANRLAYRLRQVDLDGTTSYSEERTLSVSAPEATRLHAPFPNPAQSTFTLRYGLPEATDVTIHVYDMLGRRVTTLPRGTVRAGRESLQVPTGLWSPGTYFIRMQAGQTVHTERVTVVR